MQMQYDEAGARARSLMMQQKRLCNGEATGFQCQHYLRCVIPIDAVTADHLKKGETHRRCLFIVLHDGPMDLGDGGSEMPVECNKYQPSTLKFSEEDGYNPLTPEQIKALQDADETAAATDDSEEVDGDA